MWFIYNRVGSFAFNARGFFCYEDAWDFIHENLDESQSRDAFVIDYAE